MAFDQRRPQVCLDGIIIRIGSVKSDMVIRVETSGLVIKHVRR